jgi:hypothetical protein
MPLLIKSCGREIRIGGRIVRIAQLEADGFLFLEDPPEMVMGLQSCGHRIDLFTFVQRIPETAPKYAYPMELDNFAVLPITTYNQWWTEQIGFKARNKAKQAEKKGVVVREVPFDEALARGIWQVYNEAPVRQGKPNVHYGKPFERIYRETATFLESSVFVGAFVSDTLIGFVKFVYDETRTQAATMNVVSMISHRDKAPTNALIAQVVRSCADRGISNLVYSRFAYGKKQQSSLADFKERNGFQRVDVPRYYVPLTGLGRLAYRLGMHHRLVDHLPESLAGKMRDLRASWYNRKVQSTAEGV